MIAGVISIELDFDYSFQKYMTLVLVKNRLGWVWAKLSNLGTKFCEEEKLGQ